MAMTRAAQMLPTKPEITVMKPGRYAMVPEMNVESIDSLSMSCWLRRVETLTSSRQTIAHWTSGSWTGKSRPSNSVNGSW